MNISAIVNGAAAYASQTTNQSKKNNVNSGSAVDSIIKNDNTSNTEKTKNTLVNTETKTKVSGRTIGSPELSEKAAKYYESLKQKYSNMDFILVSKDQKEQAKAQAGNYANPNKMVVLIDEEKIEKMASDENYRKQYEALIAGAATNMSQLSSSLASTGAKVKGFGMQVNDNGTASYFAVLEKSSVAQKERIEKKAEEKKEARKIEEKKAEKEREEKLNKPDSDKQKVSKQDSDIVTISADTIDDLLKKIQDRQFEFLCDNAQTETEKQIGQKIDLSV